MRTRLQKILYFMFRKVQTESATGSTSSNKIRTTLTIQVEATDFDIQAGVLRVKGRNVEENQYVKVFFWITNGLVLVSDNYMLDLKYQLQYNH